MVWLFVDGCALLGDVMHRLWSGVGMAERAAEFALSSGAVAALSAACTYPTGFGDAEEIEYQPFTSNTSDISIALGFNGNAVLATEI